MELKHIGLNIQKEEELVDFYQNILGFQFEYQFKMPIDLCEKFFGINKQLDIFLYKREDILLELFVYSANPSRGFSHLCLEVTNRENIATKCKQGGYQVIRTKRIDKPDILFIKDKTENIFELKNKQNV